MTPRILIILALCAAIPGWSQATGTGTGTGTSTGTAATDEQPDSPIANDGMLTPPPVSGQAYPVLTGAEERRNYLNLGVTTNIAYDDNVEGGYTGVSQGDMIYSIWPTISLNQSSPRLHEILNYSPGFAFFQPSTVFNAIDQNVTTYLQYLMSATTKVDLQDNFVRSSSVFDQPFSASQGVISGTGPTQTAGAVAAFADRLTNAASAQITNQTGDNGMMGLSANYSQLNYPDSKEVAGLFNAKSYEGAAFATQRITREQYLGVNVQHARIVSYLTGTDNVLQRDNIFGFYTIYLRNQTQNTLSLSITAGPEHYSIAQYPEAMLSRWAPAGTVSLGWQGHLSSASASYSHANTAGGGLSGAYQENVGQATFRQQLRLTWDLNVSGAYTRNVALTPNYPFAELGGHTMAAGVSADHTINRSIRISFGYDWMDQSYKSVVSLAPIPISNREYGEITYQFTRPIGR
jgi:hypothetical protein